MMAKMFYTLDEAKVALAKNEEEIKQFAREGRLREFRDGPRLMFKADQVEQLKNELASGMDQINLQAESGAPIGLIDTSGGSGSGSGISLVDSETSGDASATGTGMQMQMKDDTAMAGDMGLSGTVGGIPSPPAPGGTVGGSGAGSVAGKMTGSLAGSMGGTVGGTTAGTRGGINVFSDDTQAPADPMAQTAISSGIPDQVSLEGTGSGSGLLDLTRESDDTSLGAELLDEIAPGASKKRPKAGDSSIGTGVASLAEPRGRAAGVPIMVEARDPSATAYGALALGAALVLLVGGVVLTSAVMGTRPSLVTSMMNIKIADNLFWGMLACALGLPLVFGIIGLLVGKSSRS